MDEVLTEVPDVSVCWAACELKPDCKYYVHYVNDNTCNLYSTQNEGANFYACDIIRGPAGQNYEELVSFFVCS